MEEFVAANFDKLLTVTYRDGNLGDFTVDTLDDYSDCEINITIILPDYPNTKLDLNLSLEELVPYVYIKIMGYQIKPIYDKIREFITENSEDDFVLILTKVCSMIEEFARRFIPLIEQFPNYTLCKSASTVFVEDTFHTEGDYSKN